MDTNLNTISIADMTDLLRREFEMVGQHLPNVATALFQKDERGLNSGEFALYEEFDTDTFASWKPQGTPTAKARAGVGYQKQAKVRRFGIEIDITDEMRKFNKKPEFISKATNLVNYAPERIELDLTHRLTFASATSYVDRDGNTIDLTVGDGLALASSAHTLKYSSTTWSNIVSGAPTFGRTGLEAAELLAVTNIYNNFGEKRKMNFNTLFYTDNPTTENLVMELLQSTASISSGINSGVKNVYQAKYKTIKLPYLATNAQGQYDVAKKGYWGICASGSDAGAWQAYFPVWEAPYMVDPMTTPSLVDGHSDIWTYGTRTSYDVAIVSGRGFIISLAS